MIGKVQVTSTTFDETYNSLPAKGWLDKDEATLLYNHAFAAEGPILEVGCYYGRSTVLLASLGREMYCVDPFKGFDSNDPDGSWAMAGWTENMLRNGILFDISTPGLALWHELDPNLPKPRAILFVNKIEDWKVRPVGFAYLDGDHTYQGTRNQITVALDCGAKVIAVHDVNDHGEGAEIKQACLELLGPWTERVNRLAVWRRE